MGFGDLNVRVSFCQVPGGISLSAPSVHRSPRLTGSQSTEVPPSKEDWTVGSSFSHTMTKYYVRYALVSKLN
eukprot:3088385-Amphidinium_carterae.1